LGFLEMIRKERSLQIQKIIKKNPGIHYREIMRMSGLKNGVLSHYLGKLENQGIITVIRSLREKRFYPPKFSNKESIAINALRKRTPHDLLLTLLNQDGLEFNELVNKVKKSPSTVSLYLSQIVYDRLVEIKLENQKKKYYIKSRGSFKRLITKYNLRLIEHPISEFRHFLLGFLVLVKFDTISYHLVFL
jgi:predicted transcriptional regulator